MMSGHREGELLSASLSFSYVKTRRWWQLHTLHYHVTAYEKRTYFGFVSFLRPRNTFLEATQNTCFISQGCITPEPDSDKENRNTRLDLDELVLTLGTREGPMKSLPPESLCPQSTPSSMSQGCHVP